MLLLYINVYLAQNFHLGALVRLSRDVAPSDIAGLGTKAFGIFSSLMTYFFPCCGQKLSRSFPWLPSLGQYFTFMTSNSGSLINLLPSPRSTCGIGVSNLEAAMRSSFLRGFTANWYVNRAVNATVIAAIPISMPDMFMLTAFSLYSIDET